MITFLLPAAEYDPTEAGVIWQSLVDNGFDVQFATPDGEPAHADERLTDTGFGVLSPLLMTEDHALERYEAMSVSDAFQNPVSYADVDVAESRGLYVPGGHAEGMKSLLESPAAQEVVVAAFDRELPVGSVCHGVLLLARSIDPETGQSVLHGRETTALPRFLELGAWGLTWAWLRDYYRTYDATVEGEVKDALASPDDFHRGPILPLKDSPRNLDRGFTVRDGNYISARWPGDCYSLAQEFVELLEEYPEGNDR